MFHLDATETGIELSQPRFELTSLIMFPSFLLKTLSWTHVRYLGQCRLRSHVANALTSFSLIQVVFFDNDGHVTMVEESQKKKRQSEANLYVVPYGR